MTVKCKMQPVSHILRGVTAVFARLHHTSRGNGIADFKRLHHTAPQLRTRLLITVLHILIRDLRLGFSFFIAINTLN